jgi:hypothetical protein
MTATFAKKLTAGLVLAVGIVGGSGSAPAQKKTAANQIATIDPPGAGKGAGQG